MADRDQPDLPSLDFLQDKMPQLALSNEIQHGTDLVRQKETGSPAQSPCNAETLKFPAGKLCRKPVHPVLFNSQSLDHPLFHLVSFQNDLFHPQSGIDGKLRLLPDHLYRAVSLVGGKRPSIQQYFPCIRLQIAGQKLAERCLAISAGSLNSYPLMAVHRQAEMLQDLLPVLYIAVRYVS